VPIDPAARVMHSGDVSEVGRAVAAALAAGDQTPDGSYLGVCGGVYSFNDFVGTLNALQQPQLPRSEPVGQPTESSQLAQNEGRTDCYHFATQLGSTGQYGPG
jgi:hypothetical protein